MAEPHRAVLAGHGLAWAAGERYVLLDADVALPRGSLTVLWGDNGAGKSTLLDLLAGLRPPLRGSVSLHGVSLGEVHPAELACRVARIGHQPGVLLDLTAHENVAWLLP
jgi:ABC-type transport system involved in cytochrome c biogenesis ATPase subunit